MALTKQQIENNIKKIKLAEQFIQKYVKNYKLSDLEVYQMANAEDRQQIFEESRLELSDEKDLLVKRGVSEAQWNEYAAYLNFSVIKNAVYEDEEIDIPNEKQNYLDPIVLTWFNDFKKHLAENGINIKSKEDLMKIKVCVIPDFENDADIRSGELSYPCSEMQLAPKEDQIEMYSTLNTEAITQGEILFQTAEKIRKAVNDNNLKEAIELKIIYNQQVEDAKKAQQDLTRFKADTFGKFYEDLVNSMAFPKDDEYEKIEKLFISAQKKELFIEDDPLKEGEYHIVYADKNGIFTSTPTANKIQENHPMQVDFMNLDKAKGFGAAFNGKIYDETYVIERMSISNTIRTEKKNMTIEKGQIIEVNKDALQNYMYKDEVEMLEHDSKRYDKLIKDAKIAEKMVTISKSLEYQKSKIEGLKEVVENTADKETLNLLNKESLHYASVKDLMHYASMLNLGKKINDKETADMQEKLAALCVMREYKVGKPLEYAKASAQEVFGNVQKLCSYQGFKEACKDLTAEKLVDIVDGAAAKEFSKNIYQNVKKMDKVEKPEHVKKIEERDIPFAEKKPNMPFI